jgi:4-cresol dehydrogenase (hydroxylating)
MPDPTLAHLYPYGIGPMLDGLFFQSNFGIVTSATVDLIPEPESGISIMAKIRKDADLEALVDAFAELRRAGVIRTVVHIGNRERTMITLGPIVAQHLAERVTLGGAELAHLAEECLATAGFGPWSAVVGVMGSRRDTRQALRTIKRRLKGLASVTMINSARLDRAEAVLSRLRWVRGLDKKLALLKSVRPLFDLSNGIPTDAAVLSVDWPVDNKVPPDHPNPDQGHAGMLYCLPFLPLSGACAREVVSMTRETCGKHGFTAYMTLNVVDSKSLECVTSISFDRDDDARAEQAQACIRTLQDQLVERGFYPYRVGLQYMDQLIDPEDTFWKTVRDLKQVLDPNHIISPGRYNLV